MNSKATMKSSTTMKSSPTMIVHSRERILAHGYHETGITISEPDLYGHAPGLGWVRAQYRKLNAAYESMGIFRVSRDQYGNDTWEVFLKAEIQPFKDSPLLPA